MKMVGKWALNDVVYDENGDILVANDSEKKLHVYSKNEFEDVKYTVAVPENPWGVTISSSGELFMTSKSKHCVFTYKRHPENTSSLQFGSEGSKPGQFRNPHSLAFMPSARRLLCVADSGNQRVQFFTEQGEFVKSLKMPEDHEPLYLAPTEDEHLIVSCTSKNKILIYNIRCEEPELVNQLEGCESPHGVVVDKKDGLVYVCCPYDGINVY